MKVVFDELASKEFNDAIEYYEFEFEGLGQKFRGEIKRAIKTLKRFPKIGVVEEGDIIVLSRNLRKGFPDGIKVHGQAGYGFHSHYINTHETYRGNALKGRKTFLINLSNYHAHYSRVSSTIIFARTSRISSYE